MSACPYCNTIKTRVYETRVLQNGWTRRGRICEYDCRERWFTYEVPDSALSVSGMHEDDLKEFPRKRQR